MTWFSLCSFWVFLGVYSFFWPATRCLSEIMVVAVVFFLWFGFALSFISFKAMFWDRVSFSSLLTALMLFDFGSLLVRAFTLSRLLFFKLVWIESIVSLRNVSTGPLELVVVLMRKLLNSIKRWLTFFMASVWHLVKSKQTLVRVKLFFPLLVLGLVFLFSMLSFSSQRN